MALTTTTKLAVMETEMKAITNKLDSHIENHKIDFSNLNTKLDNLVDAIEDRYAGKWVERIAMALIAAVIIGFITVLFAIVRGG